MYIPASDAVDVYATYNKLMSSKNIGSGVGRRSVDTRMYQKGKSSVFAGSIVKGASLYVEGG